MVLLVVVGRVCVGVGGGGEGGGVFGGWVVC